MNAMKASIGQLKYRHIFKLMFSCFNLMQCLFYVYSLKLVAITDGFVFTTIRIFRRQNSLTLLSLAKSRLKQGGQIVRLISSYGNSGYSIRLFTDVCFAYKVKEIKHH